MMSRHLTRRLLLSGADVSKELWVVRLRANALRSSIWCASAPVARSRSAIR